MTAPVGGEPDRYDALLLLSFGGPEGPDDVLPFLENVTRGRGVPPERLAGVAEHYLHFGGVSPINDQNRALIAAVRAELDAHAADTPGLDLPIYWGNRNWRPFLEETVRTMAADGVRNALVLVTSAYSSYSSCRQYQDDLTAACAAVGDSAPAWAKLRHFFDHPGFIEPQVDAVRSAVASVAANDASRVASTRPVFTAHSIPVAMAEGAGPDGNRYIRQLRAAAEVIASQGAPTVPWALVFQSRSGPPSVPWLEPDVRDHLRVLATEGVTDIVVVPVGFVSDHLEVRWDLDVEAAAVAEELGLHLMRTPTPGTDPRFVTMVRELVEERLDPAEPKRALTGLGPSWDTCPLGCCGYVVPARP